MANECNRAWIEIDKKRLSKNIQTIKGYLPDNTKIMPVIKANGYGHGSVLIAKELIELGIVNLCVATISEAIELREQGIKCDILILGYTHPNEFKELISHNLVQTVVDFEHAKKLEAFGENIRVHIKLDIGMHRLGEISSNINQLLEILNMKHITIEGFFSHLWFTSSNQESVNKYIKQSVDLFYSTINRIKQESRLDFKTHVFCSNFVLEESAYYGDYVRVGSAIYGINCLDENFKQAKLMFYPILSLKARIVVIKEIDKGESVGYNSRYTATEKRKIATISIGYADGLPFSLSCGKGRVLVSGKVAPIIGEICMDQAVIDITGIMDVNIGDEITIIGKSGDNEITIYDVACKAKRPIKEILSGLGKRLDRIVV